MCWYENFREKMKAHKNEEVLGVMDILDELDSRKNTEEEIDVVSKTISTLNANEIVKAQLYRKLRVYQKRVDRTVPIDFGTYLRYLREKNGYSLKDIEQEVGISTSYLNRLEMSKKMNPSYPILAKLARVFDVPIAQMLSLAISQEGSTDIIELLIATTFSVRGHLFENKEKELVVRILKTIIDSEWKNETIFRESIELMEKVNTFKLMMVSLEAADENSVAI